MNEATASHWLVTHGETLQFALFFGLFALLAAAEHALPRRPATAATHGLTSQRWRANLSLTGISIAVLMLIPVSFFAAATWAQDHHIGLLNFVAMPLPLLLAANLLLRGGISFLTHFLMHKIPLLWRVHRVHHLDTEIDVSTTVRFHPLELVVGPAIGIPLVILLGLSPWMLVLYEALDVTITLWSHANVRVPERVDSVLRRIVVTPNLHRIHHSAWQPETDSNFSAVFPVWDMVFGTFRTTTRQPHEQMTLGLDEVRGAETTRVGWLLASPRKAQL